MKRALVFLLCGISFSVLAADKASTGHPAPPLNLEKLLQAPADAVASWESLKGKVVVLEFWATWCGPCIEAVPHLNELADEFKDKGVQFIAITDEKESVVQPFLKRKAMRAWVGLDTDRSMFKDYGVSGIPHTVVVGTNGVIAWVTHPTALSATVLSNVLAGKAVGLPAPRREEKRVAAEPSETRVEPPLFQVLLRPSSVEDEGSSSSSGPSGTGPAGKMYRAERKGVSLASLAYWAYHTTESRMVTNSALPEGKFDVLINVPYAASERIPELLSDTLETTFGLRGRKETRDVDVYELTAKESKLEETVSTGGSSSSSGPGRMSAVNTPIRGLARSLENQLKKPVLDKTGLTNRYDLQLKWKQEGREVVPEILIEAVRNQLGLELTPAKRPVELLVLEVEKPVSDK
jgi:uncharacterized protein (TIGR03435 family)